MTIVRLTDYVTTTITITSGAMYQVEYTPHTPDVSVEEFAPETLRDGGELVSITRRNVTEPFRILFTGASFDEMRELINAIEAFLIRCELYATKSKGHPGYIEFQADEDDEVYRSQLLSARAVPEEDLLEPWVWDNYEAEYSLIWTRRFYWEGPRTELRTTNGSGSNVLGGITVPNSGGNYVLIDGDDVKGVLPAPIELSVTNTYNVAQRMYNLYVAHNAWSNPQTFTHILEGESGTGGVTITASGFSNGQYKQCVWAGATEVKLLDWTLSSALMSAAAGAYFRVLARFASDPFGANLQVRFRLRFELTTIWEGPYYPLGSGRLQELGALQLPPYLVGSSSTTLYPLTLSLYAKAKTGGQIDLDFLQFSGLDSFRLLQPRGYGLAYGARLVDDGIANLTYTDGWSQPGRTGHYIGVGSPIMLWPGRDQRLYFLADTDTGSSEINRTSSVQLFYRPRRLTV